MVSLGFLPEGSLESYASDVSADGAIVVGGSSTAEDEKFEAFRWTQGDGMVGLGYLSDGDFDSYANDVSADGSTVVGMSGSSDAYQAFRWTQSDGMVGLGYLQEGDLKSCAHGVSADGSTVVGYSISSSGYTEAFRWTQSDKMVGLGFLPDANESVALGVSADGSTVVGYSGSGYNTEAFIWNETNGMRNLKDLLTDIGHLDLNSWTLSGATGISSDGKTVVGIGMGPNGNQGWVANLEPPPVVKRNGMPWILLLLDK
jgi:probable HAF family extracellular repeat protein